MPRPKFHAHEARKKYGWAGTRDYRLWRVGATLGVSTRCVTAALLLALVPALCRAANVQCAARSAGHTTALVELYTAALCAGCERASAWLSTLGRARSVESVIPILLRIEDRAVLREDEVRQRLSSRQLRLLPLQRTALVYSPQVLLQGREFSDWNRPEALGAALDRIGASPERARITIAIHDKVPGRLAAAVEAQVVDARQVAESVLYFAPFSSDAHHRAVLEWLGPVAVRPDGHISASRILALPSSTVPRGTGVVAFVQNRRTREVLQALLLAACSP